MSQEKVDRYKEEKKNRQKIMKKENRHERAIKACGILVALVLVGWIGYSGYSQFTKGKAAEGKNYSVDTAALDDFMNNLPGEETGAE